MILTETIKRIVLSKQVVPLIALLQSVAAENINATNSINIAGKLIRRTALQFGQLIDKISHTNVHKTTGFLKNKHAIHDAHAS